MAKKSKAQVWAEYAAAKLVLDFFGLLPRAAAVSLGILSF